MIDRNQVLQYQTAYDRAYKKYQRDPDSKEGMEFLKQAIRAQIDMADLFPEENGKENFERTYHLKRAEELISILEAAQPLNAREPEKACAGDCSGAANAAAAQSASGPSSPSPSQNPQADLSKEEKELEKKIDSVRVKKKPTTTFDDIKGLEHVKKSLLELCAPDESRREIYKFYNVELPRRFLFYGPPGTGKTMLAEAFANAMFQDEEDAPFFLVNGNDLISCYVGETSKAIDALFTEAQNHKNSVIFMDDVDSFFRSRKLLEKSDEIRNLTTFLTALDGFGTKNDTSIVICATNSPESIDDAILGRFPQRVEIPLPDEEARRAMILDGYLKAFQSNLPPSTVERLVEGTKNYNGRDIKSLCLTLKKNFCDWISDDSPLPYPDPIPEHLIEEVLQNSRSSVDLKRVQEMHDWANRGKEVS